MTIRPGITTARLATVLLVAVLAASCSLDPGPDVRRGPVSLEGFEAALVAPDRLGVEVPSCNGDPVLSEIVEEQEQVRIEITTTVTDPGDACLDSLEIQLEQPLGQRVLIDATSGARLQVRPAP